MQQIEAGAAVHVPLDELEPVDLAFDVALARWLFRASQQHRDPVADGRLSPPVRSLVQLQAMRQRREVSVAEHAEEALG